MHVLPTILSAWSRCLQLTRKHRRCGLLVIAVLLALLTETASAQPADPEPLRPGEAFVTRFSGVLDEGKGEARIDPDGVVGSIIDLRAPQQPPQGQHWIDEPQRAEIRAREVGQVFGVAVDDASPPNIYVTATSAFGLHLAPGGDWMEGMWGDGGGPGTVYRLDARNGYRPRPFAEIRYQGRPNTGAALGNITFDPYHGQLFVSDLETGLIHRISASDGTDLGFFDHGTEARPSFFDVPSGETKSLPPIAFDPASRARIDDCHAGPFEQHPECWNFAASGRRVWGVGVWRHPDTGEVRLYYAVWSGPAFGNSEWASLSEDEKRNSVWSVRIRENGDFDPSDVRREFLLPDFFVSEEDIARAGYSHPVSDITFSTCGDRPVMLVAERGGIRNLGLGKEYAFAHPHEARALRYELDRAGAWRPVGRYDVGFYDRREEGQPYLRANCSGGIAFGLGYDEETWIADPSKTDEFVWMSSDALCSPKGPCVLPGFELDVANEGEDAVQPAAQEEVAEAVPDDSEVHGIQGLAENAFEEIASAAAFADHPGETDAYPATGPGQSFLIDTDINVDEAGGLIEEELFRNDATQIGDIAIYQPCPEPPRAIRSAVLLPVPTGEPPYLVGHPQSISHARIASHGSYSSHNRFGSHNPYWSHSRFGSHNAYWSHSRDGSHSTFWSHNRYRSHSWRQSHNRYGSHNRIQSHFRVGSHSARASHSRIGSHSALLSHSRRGSHNQRISHTRLKSHNIALSHGRVRSHTTALSHGLKGSHNLALSHNKQKSHSTIVSKGPVHVLAKSKAHSTVLSNIKVPDKVKPIGPKLPPGVKEPRPRPRPPITTPPKVTVPPKAKPQPDVKITPEVKPSPKLQTLPKIKPRPKDKEDSAPSKPPPKMKVSPEVTRPKVRLPSKTEPPPKAKAPPKVKPQPLPQVRPKVESKPQVKPRPRFEPKPKVQPSIKNVQPKLEVPRVNKPAPKAIRPAPSRTPPDEGTEPKRNFRQRGG